MKTIFFSQYFKLGLLESTVLPNIGLVSVSFILLGAEEDAFNTLPCSPTPEDAPMTVVSPSLIQPLLASGRAELWMMRASPEANALESCSKISSTAFKSNFHSPQIKSENGVTERKMQGCNWKCLQN